MNGDVNIFGSFRDKILGGLGLSDKGKVALVSNYNPDYDWDCCWEDIKNKEIDREGYQKGGLSIDLGFDNNGSLHMEELTWTSIGPLERSHAILYDESDGALLAAMELDIKLGNGDSLTLVPNSDGLIQIDNYHGETAPSYAEYQEPESAIEYMCGYCGTPQPIERLFCHQCGGSRSFTRSNQ